MQLSDPTDYEGGQLELDVHTYGVKLANDFKKYLKVGEGKLEKVVTPTINAYNTIQKAVTESKNPTTSVTTSNSAVNSSVSNTASNKEGATNTQMTTSQTSAKLKRTTRMSSPIARILHFSFEPAEDSELWVIKLNYLGSNLIISQF